MPYKCTYVSVGNAKPEDVAKSIEVATNELESAGYRVVAVTANVGTFISTTRTFGFYLLAEK